MPLIQLRKRSDFLKCAQGRRANAPGLLLQGLARGEGDAVRVGFTCSKKVGNAVARNRARRRLREVARLDLAGLARPGWDYVLIGKCEATADRGFEELRADLRQALEKVHK
jgi:ribonuclease P protein component